MEYIKISKDKEIDILNKAIYWIKKYHKSYLFPNYFINYTIKINNNFSYRDYYNIFLDNLNYNIYLMFKNKSIIYLKSCINSYFNSNCKKCLLHNNEAFTFLNDTFKKANETLICFNQLFYNLKEIYINDLYSSFAFNDLKLNNLHLHSDLIINDCNVFNITCQNFNGNNNIIQYLNCNNYFEGNNNNIEHLLINEFDTNYLINNIIKSLTVNKYVYFNNHINLKQESDFKTKNKIFNYFNNTFDILSIAIDKQHINNIKNLYIKFNVNELYLKNISKIISNKDVNINFAQILNCRKIEFFNCKELIFFINNYNYNHYSEKIFNHNKNNISINNNIFNIIELRFGDIEKKISYIQNFDFKNIIVFNNNINTLYFRFFNNKPDKNILLSYLNNYIIKFNHINQIIILNEIDNQNNDKKILGIQRITYRIVKDFENISYIHKVKSEFI